jgi:hypothetical protein
MSLLVPLAKILQLSASTDQHCYPSALDGEHELPRGFHRNIEPCPASLAIHFQIDDLIASMLALPGSSHKKPTLLLK